jgi:hypothetical protein
MTGMPKNPKNWVSTPKQTMPMDLGKKPKAAAKFGGMPTSPKQKMPRKSGGR